MDLREEDRLMILGALDSLGMALTEHNHEWDEGERAIYELAIEILTPNKTPV